MVRFVSSNYWRFHFKIYLDRCNIELIQQSNSLALRNLIYKQVQCTFRAEETPRENKSILTLSIYVTYSVQMAKRNNRFLSLSSSDAQQMRYWRYYEYKTITRESKNLEIQYSSEKNLFLRVNKRSLYYLQKTQSRIIIRKLFTMHAVVI